jgi:mannose-6-phosphate isomerase-like protein (cupin superfamily)
MSASGTHNPPEFKHAEDMEWEMGRFGNVNKFLFHPRPERPTEPNAGFLKYAPGASFPLHRHDFAQVWYIIEGELTFAGKLYGLDETERLIAVYRNANEVIVGTQDEVYSRRGLINRTILTAAEIGDQIVRILERRLAAMRAEFQKLGRRVPSGKPMIARSRPDGGR